jgi:hypothetical protein
MADSNKYYHRANMAVVTKLLLAFNSCAGLKLRQITKGGDHDHSCDSLRKADGPNSGERVGD